MKQYFLYAVGALIPLAIAGWFLYALGKALYGMFEDWKLGKELELFTFSECFMLQDLNQIGFYLLFRDNWILHFIHLCNSFWAG